MPVMWMQPGLQTGWISAAGTALLAAAVVLTLYSISLRVALRLASRYPIAAALMNRSRAPASWSLAIASVQFVWDAVPETLPGLASVRHATALVLIALVTWLGVRLVGSATQIAALLRPLNVADNLQARRLQTQVEVLRRILLGFVLLVGVGSALMTFPSVRQIGTSLLASAGVAGLVAGLAARPVLSNVIAGMQIAITQPLRIDDVLIVEGEWGRVEELTGAFVVLRLWDERRLVIPLQWFIEHPFQNWTRTSAEILGTVFLWVDFCVPIEELRAELKRLCAASPDWDGRLALLQVTDSSERAMQLRALVSAADSSRCWDLRCHVREGLLTYLCRQYPEALPRLRAQCDSGPAPPDPGGAG